MAPDPNSAPPPAADRASHWSATKERLGWLGILGLTIYFLKISWLKWPDPQIDFGAQLYTPWRLAEGDVLYRDIAQHYGPLSPYFNALLFALFGPGLIVLVTANLVIFGIILFTLARLIRAAWGAGAAVAASAVFVAVFGFSQYQGVGNSNYVTPYAHESTHGFLVCLLLVASLARWLQQSTPRQSALVGFLLGLTAVLKPEFMLAGGALTLTTLLLHGRTPLSQRGRHVLCGVAGAILPTLLFLAWFAAQLPLPDAARAATRAWSIILTAPEIAANPLQGRFLGFDAPGANLQSHLAAAGCALLIFASLAGAVWLCSRIVHRGAAWALAAAVTVFLAWLSCTRIEWLGCGQCLLGLLALYLGAKAWQLGRSCPGSARPDATNRLRLLFAVLALSLLARMVLNGRLYQFGFYQAALAAIVIPAVLLGELPECFKLARSKVLVIAGTLALIVPGTFQLASLSSQILAEKTKAVGQGRDKFYALPATYSLTGRIVDETSEFLRHQPPGTVLVLPEGLMVNYLARRVSPVPPLLFYFDATANGREAELVQRLEQHPPAWTILLNRDLREVGIPRYGEKSGSGRELLAWIAAHYEAGATFGGDPLDPAQQGVIIYRRR